MRRCAKQNQSERHNRDAGLVDGREREQRGGSDQIAGAQPHRSFFRAPLPPEPGVNFFFFFLPGGPTLLIFCAILCTLSTPASSPRLGPRIHWPSDIAT